jgi:hypothetical protein
MGQSSPVAYLQDRPEREWAGDSGQLDTSGGIWTQRLGFFPLAPRGSGESPWHPDLRMSMGHSGGHWQIGSRSSSREGCCIAGLWVGTANLGQGWMDLMLWVPEGQKSGTETELWKAGSLGCAQGINVALGPSPWPCREYGCLHSHPLGSDS